MEKQNCADNEPESEENELIEEIFASLKKDKTVRTEREILKATQPSVHTDSFETLVNKSEVVLEDGLTINDVLNKEIVFVNEIEGNGPGTSYQVSLNENIYESTMEFSSLASNSTNNEELEATNVTEKVDERSINEDDPDDPDFVLSDNDLMENFNNKTNSTLDESSNNYQGNCCVIEESNVDSKRKRKKRPDKSSWNVVIHKKLRMTGKKYVGYKKVNINGKATVKRSEHEREERKMGPACNSKICKANKKRKCTEITEKDRQNLFKYFWPLSWKEKKVYIRDHVKQSETQHKTVKDQNKNSRRSGTYKYYLSPNNSEFKPVCKVMFLNTFGLKEWMVHNWTTNKDDIFQSETKADHQEINYNSVVQENVTEIRSKERKVTEKKKVISEWFDSLPKVPSHYCRDTTSKLYLEPFWESKVELYRTYKEFCIVNNKPWGSLTIFMEVFENKNLSIYTPKKDQCDTCYSFKAGNIAKEIYDKHIAQKDLARSEKENDKQRAINGEIYCITADVQSVKLTPMTHASDMYYKTKLCSHNYTVYNLATRHCKCFWFTEVEGDLSANTFASCLLNYLKEHCSIPRLPIIVYTDGCTSQNRNQFVSNALLHFAVKNEVEITQKYLIKGHTQMEGDSVHSKIENKIKGKDVYMPYEYVKYTKEARQEPFPYDAVYLKHDFFKDYSNINYYDSVRPGRKKGDPCVVDVHGFKYCCNGRIQFKLSFNDEFVDLPRRPNKVKKDLEPLHLFKQKIPIPFSKWKHLKELKVVIPEDYHNFYDSLRYHNK